MLVLGAGRVVDARGGLLLPPFVAGVEGWSAMSVRAVEGVDYPGEMLKAVAVIGPCLPAVSLEQELLRRYYDERFERGFEYAFVVPGMTRVVQAAGRLIRSATDTGVIALFDERFLLAPYRRHLPDDWLEPGNPDQVAKRFFGL